MGHRCEANLEKGVCLNTATVSHWRGHFCADHDPGDKDQCDSPAKGGKRCLKWATVIRNNFAYCKDHDPGECPMTQTREQFIEQFVTQFLASWCAEYYENRCSNGQQEELYNPPIEDAYDIASHVWNNILKLRE